MMPRSRKSRDPYRRIKDVVRRVPCGRVATYGQIAELAGLPGRARQVGYALSALPEDSALPWHRIVNARGEVSERAEPGYDVIQRRMLEDEGVSFRETGRIDLERFRWKPRVRNRSSS